MKKQVAPPLLHQWQPIETAPTDNRRPLYLAVMGPDGQLQEIDFDGSWDKIREEEGYPSFWGWCTASGRVEEPTHWSFQGAEESGDAPEDL